MADLPRRLVWWLVWCYPPRFRRDVGQGLVDALDDRMRARRAAGASSVSIWARAIADTVRNATAEWIDEVRRGRRDTTYQSISHDRQGRTTMDKLLQDVRYAFRLWRRRPGFAFVAILTLALGIGANTAMFSIVNAVLLRPLPYAHGDRLAVLWAKTPTRPQSLLSWDEYLAYRDQKASFDAVALWLGQSVNLTAVNEPQRIVGVFATGSFFDVLEVKAERGRFFSEEEGAAGTAQPVVVISHAFWQRHFASDPSAIGATLTLNGIPLTVIGVMAAPFDLSSVPADGWFINYDVFMPVGLFPVPGGVANAGPGMLGVTRLKPGVTLTAANANLAVVSGRLLASNPKAQTGRTAEVVSAQESIVGDSRTPLLLLLASVGVVLLIACVNVSNLLVARAVDRQREIALRSALGASRWAVLRQLAVEATLLATVSAALGFVIGRWSLQGLTWLRPPSVPIPDQIPLDASVLLFTFGVGAAVALLCGLAPALRITQPDLSRVLQAGGRRTTGGARVTRDALVVAEIALSVALIAVSGLLIHSMLSLQRVSVGFDSSSVFTLQFRLPASKYARPEDIARFFRETVAQVRGVAGIESVALVRRVPFSGNWGDTPFTVEGRPVPAGQEPRAGQNIVTPDYFKTMRIPLTRGRDFTDRDDLQSLGVTVINETMARTTWPGDDPIGKHIKVPDFKEPLTVVGVVGDTKHRSSTEPAQAQLYLAHYQLPMIFSSLVARTAVPPLNLTKEVRRAIWQVDKDQPMWSVTPLDALVDQSHGSTRFLASLLAMFSGVALLLAAVGIYGVMSYAVTERTHEIGIRMALGASADRVMREMVGRGLTLTAIALALGVPAAISLGRLARGVLFGVEPSDPVTLGGAAILLALVSLAACYLPARRASRVDPVVALAEE
jgi:putative ABC transport system permease protein